MWNPPRQELQRSPGSHGRDGCNSGSKIENSGANAALSSTYRHFDGVVAISEMVGDVVGFGRDGVGIELFGVGF